MKVAVMQPYLFPYLGYYQLVNCVDTFVLYDDVTFIKRGWINRNKVLSNGEEMRLTLPVPGASQNVLIKKLQFTSETSKFLKSIEHAYYKAPNFEVIYPVVDRVINEPNRDVTSICEMGITEVFQYLGLEKKVIRSSDIDYDHNQPAADRLIAICEELGSSDYINSIGGKKLYSKDYFANYGCALSFLEMEQVRYSQRNHKFIPNLSMLDVLMWCDKQHVRELLGYYRLV